MAGQGHVSRKDLKEDEVHDAGVLILKRIEENRTRLMTVALVILIAIFGLKITNGIRHQRMVDSGLLLSEARRQYLNALVTEDADVRADLIEGILSRCTEIDERFADSDIGAEAHFLRGNVALLQEDTDAAISHFEKYRDASQSTLAKASAWHSIAVAQENAFFADQENREFLDAALASYQHVIDLSGGSENTASYVGYEAKMQLARLAAWDGKLKQAKALYGNIAESRPYMSVGAQAAEDGALRRNPSQLDRKERSEYYRDLFRRSQARFSFETSAKQEVERIAAHID